MGEERQAFLTEEQLCSLTGKKRRGAQVRVLNFLGITHLVRPDGSLVVLWEHVSKKLGGAAPAQSKPELEPNWDAMKRWVKAADPL